MLMCIPDNSLSNRVSWWTSDVISRGYHLRRGCAVVVNACFIVCISMLVLLFVFQVFII